MGRRGEFDLTFVWLLVELVRLRDAFFMHWEDWVYVLFKDCFDFVLHQVANLATILEE